jgi:hypothetical protein
MSRGERGEPAGLIEPQLRTIVPRQEKLFRPDCPCMPLRLRKHVLWSQAPLCFNEPEKFTGYVDPESNEPPELRIEKSWVSSSPILQRM